MPYSLPAGFSIRRPTRDDIAPLLELAQVCDVAEVGRVRTSSTDVSNMWEMPGHDPAKDAWLVIAPDDRLVAMAFVGHRPPISHLFTDVRVHPEYADLELYDYLLSISLEYAREFIPKANADVRIALSAWFHSENARFRERLELAGFAHVRSNWLMEIVMDAPPPEPVWPKGVELRPFTPDQLYAIYEADNDAFQDHWGHQPVEFEMWQLWSFKRESFDPGLWFVAYDGDEIAGIALCGIELDEAWVGELGVRRPWRRAGLGLAFLHHAFGEFYRRGHHRVILNVDSQSLTGATRLYTRAGMHPFEQTDIYELELRPGIELSTQELEV